MTFGRFIGVFGLLLLAATTLEAAGSIEGRWLLVEQSYGAGSSNLVPPEGPIRLEFTREGARLAGKIRVGGSDTAAASWPAVFVEGQARPVRVLETITSPAEDRVKVQYEIEPSSGDTAVLRVTEEYAVAENGSALAGTVTVAFYRDGESRGAYTLRRRFERER